MRCRWLAGGAFVISLLGACGDPTSSGNEPGPVSGSNGGVVVAAIPVAAAAGSSVVVLSTPLSTEDRDARRVAREFRADGTWAEVPDSPLTEFRLLASTGEGVAMVGANPGDDTLSVFRWAPGERGWDRVDWDDPFRYDADTGADVVGGVNGRAVFVAEEGAFVVRATGAVEPIPDSGGVDPSRNEGVGGRCLTAEHLYELTRTSNIGPGQSGVTVTVTQPPLMMGPESMQVYSFEERRWRSTPPPPPETAQVPSNFGCVSDGPISVTAGVEFVYDAASSQWRRVDLVDAPEQVRGDSARPGVWLNAGTGTALLPDGRALFVNNWDDTLLQRNGPGRWIDPGVSARGVVATGERVVVLRRGTDDIAEYSAP